MQASRDTLPRAFLVLNPRGNVPVLQVGDLVMYEHIAIIAFLDGINPAVPLFERTAEEHNRIWQRVCEFENHTRDLSDVQNVQMLRRVIPECLNTFEEASASIVR